MLPNRAGKMKRYVHKPFTLEDGDTKISCNEDGKVTFKKEVIIAKHPDAPKDEEDEVEEHEITVSASTIFSVANMLNTTKNVKWIDKK